MGAFTGTFDNSVNNNNFTLSATTPFNGSGSGVRTFKLGTATYTLTGNAATWNLPITTNLTFTGNTGCSIVFTGATSGRTFASGGLSYGNLTFGASSGGGACVIQGACTLASLTVTAPNYLTFPISTTVTITNAFTWTGSSGSEIYVGSSTAGSAATIAASGGGSASKTAFRDLTFTGSPTATDSFNLGNNSGISITAPSSGGSGGGIIGS